MKLKENVPLGKAIASAIIVTYLSIGMATGAWTPKQYKQMFEKLHLRNVQRTEEYKQKDFGTNRYINTNKNGKKSIDEKFEFYQNNNLTNSR